MNQPARSIRLDGPRGHHSDEIIAWLAFVLFLASLVLSICLVKVAIGPLPIRSGLLLAAIGLMGVAAPHRLIAGAKRVSRFLLIILLFAALGSAVSLINSVPTAAWIQQLVEIHVQAVFGVILVSALTTVIGIAPIVWGFIAAVAISAIVALAQALGIDAAWNLRAMTGDIMADPAITRHFYESRWRALGLSYSPVHLATQTCLAFAALFAFRLYATGGALLRRVDWSLVVGVVTAIIVCFATGNRSPIIGFLAFSFIYAALVAPRSLIVLAPMIILMAFASFHALEILQTMGLRVASTDDSSAEGRSTLMYFGLRLLLDHPIGYGLAFDSTDYWQSYSHEIIYMDNPLVIRNFALHNYLLIMMNKYGVAVLGLLALCLPRSREQWIVVLAFVPYIAHIFFHNDGPFQSDFLIWYILPLFPALWSMSRSSSKPRSWTRTRRAERAAEIRINDECSPPS